MIYGWEIKESSDKYFLKRLKCIRAILLLSKRTVVVQIWWYHFVVLVTKLLKLRLPIFFKHIVVCISVEPVYWLVPIIVWFTYLCHKTRFYIYQQIKNGLPYFMFSLPLPIIWSFSNCYGYVIDVWSVVSRHIATIYIHLYHLNLPIHIYMQSMPFYKYV